VFGCFEGGMLKGAANQQQKQQQSQQKQQHEKPGLRHFIYRYSQIGACCVYVCGRPNAT
jgi:hypothetical protein